VIERIHRGARAASIAVLIMLSACSGRGGDSGDGSPSLSVSTTSITFTAVQNGPTPAAQQIGVSITGTVFAGITSQSGAFASASFSITGQSTGVITVTPIAPNLAPGTYTGTMTFRGCPDQFCAGGDVPGSPKIISVLFIVTPALAANPNSLTFNFATGGTPPAAQPLTLTGTVGSWTSSASQPWIGVAPSSGSGDTSISVTANPNGLVPGTYNGQVTINSGGHTAMVSVALVVAAPAMQANLTSLSFAGINGATLAAQVVAITMNNGAALNWTASTPPADTWLVLDRTGGTAVDPLTVSVNPANGLLASATYTSSIALQGSSGGVTFNKNVTVTMTLTKATLASDPPSVTLGGANGRDFGGVPLQLSLNTGANSYSFGSTADSFVQRSPSSGSVSATPVTITLTPDRTGLVEGTLTGSITFAVAVNGDSLSKTVPVTFNLEAHKLLVDGNGVAFAKTPSLSRLTQTLRVRDNLGLAAPWTASPDQTWLTVTPNGTADSDLVLTADPTGLAPDTLSLATVTITSSDASVKNTETVRVGLWVGSTDPDPTTTITGLALAEIAADPIRPYAYVAVGKDIHIINVYNGSSLASISNVTPVRVGAMTVSHDGSTLYAVDPISDCIYPVNLDTYALGTQFETCSLSTPQTLEYTRVNGQPLVLSGAGLLFNAVTGRQFHGLTLPGFGAAATSRSGSRACTVDIGNSSYMLACATLDFTSLNGGQLLIPSFVRATGSGVNGADVAVSPDGAIAYVAAGAGGLPPELAVYTTQNVTRIGGFPIEGRGNGVEIAADGRIFAASTNISVSQTADVRVFDAAGNLLTSRLVAPVGPAVILDRQIKVSGDGFRLIAITGDPPIAQPTLIFTTVAP
jgi:BACON domain-containing protein